MVAFLAVELFLSISFSLCASHLPHQLLLWLVPLHQDQLQTTLTCLDQPPTIQSSSIPLDAPNPDPRTAGPTAQPLSWNQTELGIRNHFPMTINVDTELQDRVQPEQPTNLKGLDHNKLQVRILDGMESHW